MLFVWYHTSVGRVSVVCIYFSAPYEQTKRERIWHIVAALHYYIVYAPRSEALAETVGSILSYMNKRTHKTIESVDELVWSTQLRLSGLEGLGGEDAFLAKALNAHCPKKESSSSDGPGNWHFVQQNNDPSTVQTRWNHERKNRVRQCWFEHTLLECGQKFKIRWCKRLPRPSKMLSATGDSRFRKCKKRIRKEAREKLMPKMLPRALWDRVRKSAPLLLPGKYRPGIEPR